MTPFSTCQDADFFEAVGAQSASLESSFRFG